MKKKTGEQILELKDRVISNFTKEDWGEIGLRTGLTETITRYPRLLRSLSWGDDDYGGNVLGVLQRLAEEDADSLTTIADLLDRKYPVDSNHISAKPSPKKITFAPLVFEVPDEIRVEPDLVSVMMPFGAEFRDVHRAIQGACEDANLRCLRADDIWEKSTIIQDIFELLLKANIVIVDFSRKNPNVMYETGIAHTLGKVVIPISQSIDDVPFDMKHHRVLTYLANKEGLADLRTKLGTKLKKLVAD